MNNVTETLEGELGFKGERGYSAYEIAVKHGYTGTEEQWSQDFTNPDNFYDKMEMDSILSGYVETTTLTDYVPKSDIVDNVTSTDTDKPLSANQGKVLKDDIDTNYINTNGVLLWKNPNRDDSGFSAQSIQLDLTEYDSIEICAGFSDSVRMFKYVKTNSPHTKMWTRGCFTFYIFSEKQIYERDVYYNLTNSSLEFSDCHLMTVNSSTTGTNNQLCVPYYIIGYKRNLFDIDEYDS